MAMGQGPERMVLQERLRDVVANQEALVVSGR